MREQAERQDGCGQSALTTTGDLRAWLARQTAGGAVQAARPLGVAPLDKALAGGGLARVGLHCLQGDRQAQGGGLAAPLGLALAFAVHLRAALASPAPLIWAASSGFPYAPGLRGFGLAARDLLLVRAGRRDALLWALEECLRSGQAPVVLGLVSGLERVAGRRLQLAAERGQAACLLVDSHPSGAPLVSMTRWQVRAAAVRYQQQQRHVPLPERPAWQVDLQQSRGGRPAEALVEWDHATYSFSLAAQPGERNLAADAAACG
ncbi:MAG: hypothetical protein AAFY02_18860 [Pseudomonadota bacterium]